MDLCEFETSLVYRYKAVQSETCLKKQRQASFPFKGLYLTQFDKAILRENTDKENTVYSFSSKLHQVSGPRIHRETKLRKLSRQ